MRNPIKSKKISVGLWTFEYFDKLEVRELEEDYRKLEQEIEELKLEINLERDLIFEIQDLEKEFESLKCCGSCKHSKDSLAVLYKTVCTNCIFNTWMRNPRNNNNWQMKDMM